MNQSYSAVFLNMDDILSDSEFNCRGVIRPMDVVELARDIKSTGLLTPITVQPWDKVPGKKYRIVAGHCRFMAFKVNSETSIPCFITHITDDLEAHDINLKENLMRTNLNLLQEARALKPYFDKRQTDSQIGQRLSRSAGWVTPRRQLLELPTDIQKEAERDVINQQHVKSLYLLRRNPERMYEAFRAIKEAKERGEKVVNVPKEKDAVFLTKPRRPNPAELFVLLDTIHNNIVGPTGKESFGAKCFAFAAGSIPEIDWWYAYKRECERQARPFNPPEEIAGFMGD